MASVGGTPNPASSPVVDYVLSVLFPVTDDKALAEKLTDMMYAQFLVDEKQTRIVQTRGFFEDSPSMETEYYYIAALPPNYDLGSKDADGGGDDDSEDEGSDDGEDFGGYWMLFFSKDIIDDMWKRACQLLREGRFEGVNSILVSTSRRNPRATDHTTSVMLFHCEPWSDKTLMQCLGHHIAVQMSYFNHKKYLYYKSNRMISCGSRATGRRINSLIRIPVPENILGVLEKKKRLQWILNKPKIYQQWLMDQRVDYRDDSGRFYSLRFFRERSTENVPQFEYNSGS